MTDYTKRINKKADIFQDGNDVVVTDGKKEVFRKPRSKQTISIAHIIYMSEKYKDCPDNPELLTAAGADQKAD